MSSPHRRLTVGGRAPAVHCRRGAKRLTAKSGENSRQVFGVEPPVDDGTAGIVVHQFNGDARRLSGRLRANDGQVLPVHDPVRGYDRTKG